MFQLIIALCFVSMAAQGAVTMQSEKKYLMPPASQPGTPPKSKKATPRAGLTSLYTR